MAAGRPAGRRAVADGNGHRAAAASGASVGRPVIACGITLRLSVRPSVVTPARLPPARRPPARRSVGCPAGRRSAPGRSQSTRDDRWFSLISGTDAAAAAAAPGDDVTGTLPVADDNNCNQSSSVSDSPAAAAAAAQGREF